MVAVMPRYVATIRSAWPAERAFAYMADFSNAREWDPSVEAATRTSDGPVSEGDGFDLQVRSGSRVLPFHYVITQLGNRTVVLSARTTRFESVDTITVSDDGPGSLVRYDAFLTGLGVMRLANPVIGRTFRRMGDAARTQLTEVLAR